MIVKNEVNLIEYFKNALKLLLMNIGRFFFKNKHINMFNLKTQHFYNSDYHTFFGYHDISPFDSENTFMLAHRLKVKKVCKTKQAIEIGYYDLNLNDKVFNKIDTTTSWSIQQGSRLRWFEKNGQKNIVYNKTIDEKHQTVFYNLNDKKKSILNYPLYDLDNKGEYGLTLDFTRLEKLRPGYRYNDILDLRFVHKEPKNDGIWLVSIENQKKKLLIKTHDVINFENTPSMSNAFHYFNHLLFSPDGKKFFFIHAWNDENGERFTRAFIYFIENAKFEKLLPNLHVSHCCWESNNTLIVTFGDYPNKTNYYRVNIYSKDLALIESNLLNKDGHPYINTNKNNIMITDTYPNRLSIQSLILSNSNKKSIKVISRFYHNHHLTGSYRCDLHPRLSYDSKLVSVDSSLKDVRSMCVIDISKFI